MAHSSSHSERSIHEMLKDAPPMNESNSAIQSGIEGRVKHPNSLHIRTNSGMYYNALLRRHAIELLIIKRSLQLQPHQHRSVHHSTVNQGHF